MKLLEGTKNGLERIITPLTNYLGNSKVVNAITSGMMMTIPVTIGVTLFAILGNLNFMRVYNIILFFKKYLNKYIFFKFKNL